MSENNKRNLQFFEAPSMHELYDTMERWQETENKRLLSISVQRDGEKFCCIALTNPTEVVITSRDGRHHAVVDPETGALFAFCIR